MVSKRARALLGTLALATCIAPIPPVRAAPAQTFRVGLIGDTGYNAEGEQNLLRIREAANSAGLAFVAHDGDIWMGGSWCSDERLRQVKAGLNGFRSLVYAPGDNEWLDCPNGTAGRLAAIRRIFFSDQLSLGTQPVFQVRQPGVPENARWEKGGVVFTTLDVPGPNGGGPVAADLAWLDAAFDRAAATRAVAVMVIWQDDPTDGSSPSLVGKLKARAGAFGKPVMLVHGDTHQYKLDNPWRNVPNLTRLETYPTFTPQWVKVVVNPADPAVFTVARLRA
jgi:hypothetical protein